MIPSHASLPLPEVASKLWRDDYGRCSSLSSVGQSCVMRLAWGIENWCPACERAAKRGVSLT